MSRALSEVLAAASVCAHGWPVDLVVAVQVGPLAARVEARGAVAVVVRRDAGVCLAAALRLRGGVCRAAR